MTAEALHESHEKKGPVPTFEVVLSGTQPQIDALHDFVKGNVLFQHMLDRKIHGKPVWKVTTKVQPDAFPYLPPR